MFQFTYKLKVTERVKAKCNRHPRYNPEREGRGGIKGGCSTCFSLFDLHQARRRPENRQSDVGEEAGIRNGWATSQRDSLWSPAGDSLRVFAPSSGRTRDAAPERPACGRCERF
jgi:hypothetical protein